MVVVDEDEVLSLVGRIGADAVFVVVVVVEIDVEVEVERAGQVTEPQARSVGQQPPPKVAGQDWKPELQVRDLVIIEVVVAVEAVVVLGVITTTWVTVVVEPGSEEGVTIRVVVIVWTGAGTEAADTRETVVVVVRGEETEVEDSTDVMVATGRVVRDVAVPATTPERS